MIRCFGGPASVRPMFAIVEDGRYVYVSFIVRKVYEYRGVCSRYGLESVMTTHPLRKAAPPQNAEGHPFFADW